MWWSIPSFSQLNRCVTPCSVLLSQWGGREALHLLSAAGERHHVVQWRAGSACGGTSVLSGRGWSPAPSGAGPRDRTLPQRQRHRPRALCQLEPILHPLPHRTQKPTQRSHQLWQHRICMDRYISGIRWRLISTIELVIQLIDVLCVTYWKQTSFPEKCLKCFFLNDGV